MDEAPQQVSSSAWHSETDLALVWLCRKAQIFERIEVHRLRHLLRRRG